MSFCIFLVFEFIFAIYDMMIIFITIDIKLYKSNENDEILNSTYYQNIINSQIYEMLYTRLNITFAISQLS